MCKESFKRIERCVLNNGGVMRLSRKKNSETFFGKFKDLSPIEFEEIKFDERWKNLLDFVDIL